MLWSFETETAHLPPVLTYMSNLRAACTIEDGVQWRTRDFLDTQRAGHSCPWLVHFEPEGLSLESWLKVWLAAPLGRGGARRNFSGKDPKRVLAACRRLGLRIVPRGQGGKGQFRHLWLNFCFPPILPLGCVHVMSLLVLRHVCT